MDVRPEGARLTRAELPLNLPAGWDFDKVFGAERNSIERKTDGTPSLQRPERRADAGNLPVPGKPATSPATVPAAFAVASVQGGVALPKTATDAELKLWAGLLLLVLSLLLALSRYPRHHTAH